MSSVENSATTQIGNKMFILGKCRRSRGELCVLSIVDERNANL